MRNATATKSRALTLTLLALAAIILSGALSAQAQTLHWSTIASAGVIDGRNDDNSDRGTISFLNDIARITQYPTGQTVPLPLRKGFIRYNISPVPGLFNVSQYYFRVNYKDIGANARVLVRLKRAKISDGTVAMQSDPGAGTFVIFDSDSNPANLTGTTNPNRTETSPLYNFTFDFTTYTYYVEVELQKQTFEHTAAELAIIQLLSP